MLHYFLTSSLALLIVTACGLAQQDSGDAIIDDGIRRASKAPAIDIHLGVSYLNVASGLFSLLDATSYVVDVVGCKSGYTHLAHDSSVSGTTFNLYSHDRDCEVQLKSFAWNSKTWTKSGGGNYTGTSAAIFINGTDSDTISVVSPQNLPAVITSTSTVSYYFSLIEAGTAKQIVSTAAAQHLTNSSNDAPWYRMRSVTGVILDSIATGTNIATFTFRFECKNTVTTSDTICPTTNSQGQLQTDMRIALVKDTYSGSMTWTDAQNALNGAPHIINVANGNLNSPGTGFNGGFDAQIDGPEALDTSQKMILIVEHNSAGAGDRSYTCFALNFAGGTSLTLLKALLK